MTRVVVDPGVCGFTTTVEVIKLPLRKVGITITSECEKVSELGTQLREVDWSNVLSLRETVWSTNARQCLAHVVTS